MGTAKRSAFLTAKQVGLIHVAKAKLGLSDVEYRNLLQSVCRVESAREVHPRDFPFLMARFAELGFVSDFAARSLGHRWDMATPSQVARIRDLWSELHGGELNELHLGNWLERFGASNLRFANAEVARKAIGALRTWKFRTLRKSSDVQIPPKSNS